MSAPDYFFEEDEGKPFVIDRRFQVRHRTDPRVVMDYAKAMKAGAKFPPITLADINGTLFLIDGFNRTAAAREADYQLDQVVVKMTEHEALQAAAKANITHGVRLKPTERIRAFKAYIRGRGHIKKRGTYKSYREMAEDLNGLGGHTTIRNWMNKHFPKIARQMGGEQPGNGRAEAPRVDPERERGIQCRDDLLNTIGMVDTINDPTMLFELHQLATDLVRSFERKTMTEPDF